MQTISARRVDEDGSWDFFWGRDVDGRVLLLLRHGGAPVPSRRLPHLRGIDVLEMAPEADERSILCFRLLDSEHRDIFQSLCEDIVGSAATATTEDEAVAVALMRTWRWHHLLRGGGNSRLSAEEQKGLIGELLFLEREILTRYSAAEGLRSWRGPLGSPKDFEIGSVCIESKARRGAATPYVAISSEHQLDDHGLHALFLHVIDLHPAPDDVDAESVDDVARRVRGLVATQDPAVLEEFEMLLASAGFRWSDEYLDSRWEQGATQLFRIKGAFPRLIGDQMLPGISRVTYAVALQNCEPFRVDVTALDDALGEAEDAGHAH